MAKTKKVMIRLSAIGPPLIRKTDLDKKITSIIEADRLAISQVISEVSVDIVKEVKKIMKDIGRLTIKSQQEKCSVNASCIAP